MPQYKNIENGLESDNFPKDISEAGGSGATESSFHIDALKSKFRDLARPNQFKVRINPPAILQAEWTEQVEIMVKSAVFPSMEIDEYMLERSGLVLHIPSNKINFGELTITFWNDVDFNIMSLFNRWQRIAIFNSQDSIGSITSLALQGSVSIFQFDSYHNETYAVTASNCWPKSISEIALSHENESQAEEFSVTMPFTNLEFFKNNL